MLVKWLNDNNIRVIATTLKSELNSKLAELFSVNIELPLLKDREEDVKALTIKFSKEASATLDAEQIIPSKLMINISKKMHIALESQSTFHTYLKQLAKTKF